MKVSIIVIFFRLLTKVRRSRALSYDHYLQQVQGDEGEFAVIDQFSCNLILEGQVVSLYAESSDLGHALPSTRVVFPVSLYWFGTCSRRLYKKAQLLQCPRHIPASTFLGHLLCSN